MQTVRKRNRDEAARIVHQDEHKHGGDRLLGRSLQVIFLVTAVVVTAAASAFLYHYVHGLGGNDSSDQSSDTRTRRSRVLQSPIPSSNADSYIAEQLFAADELLAQNRSGDAVREFQNLVKQFPRSIRAQYGLAISSDNITEGSRDNKSLWHSVHEYEKVRKLADSTTPARLLIQSMLRLSNLYTLAGQLRKGMEVLNGLLARYPDDTMVMKEFSHQCIKAEDFEKAKIVLEGLLEVRPDDGFALCHLGYIWETKLEYEKAVPLLYGGVRGDDNRCRVANIYLALGDSLQKLRRRHEAYEIYREATERGVFLSTWQRSRYNVPNLKAQPWWDPSETPYEDIVHMLEANWKTIRNEGLSIMNNNKDSFQTENLHLRETGDWKQFILFARGNENREACSQVPETCKIIRKIPDAAGCKRGWIKYSLLLPGTHVWPHSGPTNCRLRMHLGLVVPDNVRIRVGNETRTWEEGKVVIIDDSIEHEVWQEAKTMRLIFIVDVWHPDLSDYQKKTLDPF